MHVSYLWVNVKWDGYKMNPTTGTFSGFIEETVVRQIDVISDISGEEVEMRLKRQSLYFTIITNNRMFHFPTHVNDSRVCNDPLIAISRFLFKWVLSYTIGPSSSSS